MPTQIERVVVFGDMTDIRPQELSDFIKTVNSSCRGVYPSYKQGLPDTEVIERTHTLLTEAGIPDPSPIILCSSAEERARRILENLCLHEMRSGNGLYWIIDSNPLSLLKAVGSVTDSNSSLCADILKSITVIGFGSASDHMDPVTGIRITILPRPFYQFPIHPTPAS